MKKNELKTFQIVRFCPMLQLEESIALLFFLSNNYPKESMAIKI